MITLNERNHLSSTFKCSIHVLSPHPNPSPKGRREISCPKCMAIFTLLSLVVAAKRIGMWKPWILIGTIAVSAILTPVSTAMRGGLRDHSVDATAHLSVQSEVPASRLARLRHGINLSHWFAQSSDYSKAHLELHTTAEDIALIKSIGFDHVRLTVDPPHFSMEKILPD